MNQTLYAGHPRQEGKHEKLLKTTLILKDWEASSATTDFFPICLMEEMGTAGQDINIHWRKVIESILKSNFCTYG